MQATQLQAERKLMLIHTKRNRWSFPFNASTINGTSINVGPRQKTKQLFKARARFRKCERGSSISLLPQFACPVEGGRPHHLLCLRHELSLCFNARPHKPI